MTGRSGSAGSLRVPDYLAFGDLGVDSVVRLDHLPQADEKIWVEPAEDFPGGMMGNATVAVASLGISAGVVALVGSDSRGDFVLDALRGRGVETRFVRRIDAATFWTLALTTPTGDRTLIQFPTRAFAADWEGFDRRLLAETRWVHTTAEQGAPVGGLLRDAQRAGAMTSLDIEFPYVQREDLAELLPHVDVAFLNLAAADTLGGPEDGSLRVRELGAGTIFVTLGERGAHLLERSGRSRFLPPAPVAAVDSNGAGDSFAGAYAAGVLKGLPELQAAELAAFVAGLSTTALGGFGPDLKLDVLRIQAEAQGYGWSELL